VWLLRDIDSYVFVVLASNRVKEAADVIVPETIHDSSPSAAVHESVQNPAGVSTSAAEMTVQADPLT